MRTVSRLFRFGPRSSQCSYYPMPACGVHDGTGVIAVKLPIPCPMNRLLARYLEPHIRRCERRELAPNERHRQRRNRHTRLGAVILALAWITKISVSRATRSFSNACGRSRLRIQVMSAGDRPLDNGLGAPDGLGADIFIDAVARAPSSILSPHHALRRGTDVTSEECPNRSRWRCSGSCASRSASSAPCGSMSPKARYG